LTLRLLLVWAAVGAIPSINALAIILVVLTGLQFLLFGMLFDMEHNQHLK
jgi:hypothetical protein